MILATISALDNDSDKEFMLDIYHRYNTLIRKTIYKLIKNPKDLEDLTNETFIKLIEKISTIRDFSCHKLTAYIVYTSKSIAIDFIKHRDVLNKHTFSGGENDLSEKLEDQSAEFEDKLIQQIDVERLCQAIHMLSEQQMNILHYKYLLDMNDAEIAKAIGISQSSVQQYLKRARTAARKLIGEGADSYAK